MRMTDSTERPLRPLRQAEIDRLLRSASVQMKLAAEILVPYITERHIVLARPQTAMTAAERKAAMRERNVADGVCKESASHGPATRGELCAHCAMLNAQAIARRRRAKKKVSIPQASHSSRTPHSEP